MKKYCLFLICVCMLLALVSCGSKKEAETLQDTHSQSEKYIQTHVDNVELLELAEIDANLDDFFESYKIENRENPAITIQIIDEAKKAHYEEFFNATLPDINFEETYLVLSIGRTANMIGLVYEISEAQKVMGIVEVWTSRSETYESNKIYCYTQAEKIVWDEMVIYND